MDTFKSKKTFSQNSCYFLVVQQAREQYQTCLNIAECSQKESNRVKSQTRCRVEHVFGFITNGMHDFYVKNIGFERIKGVIGLINLAYNMFRYEQIVRLNLQTAKVAA